MSGKERVVAAFLLAIAVAGGALIPRLLGAAPSAPLGVALGPGPARSVVEAPPIPKPPRRIPTRSNPSPRTRLQPSPVAPIASGPTVRHASAPPTKPATRPTPPPSSTPSPPPTPPPPPPPPPPTTTPTPPPALLPPVDTRPGHGYGDKNHVHTGPPGRSARPATPVEPARRSHGRDLEGSGHGPSQQVPSHTVGAHHRRVGRVAPASPAPAAHAHEAREKARPQGRGPRGEGGHGPPPQAVAEGHGPQGHGNGHGQGD